MKNVLVIEYDKLISELISIHLKDMICNVNCVFDGREGLTEVLKNNYDLIVLDLILPHLDGLEICKELDTIKDQKIQMQVMVPD